MPHYTPPLRDMRFVLHELLDAETSLRKLPSHADIDRATIDAVLEEGGRFCADVLFPLNASGDQEGCKRAADGSVTTPKGFKEAYRQFVDSGWASLLTASSSQRPASSGHARARWTRLSKPSRVASRSVSPTAASRP